MMAKTDWQMGDTVKPDDLNQIGQEINQNRDNLAAHTAATTGVHGATSAATPNTLVQRDPAGRFKAAAPVEADDVARKQEIDAHASDTTKHVNLLSENQYTAAEPVVSYPLGVSVMRVTDSDFPASNGYGNVLTVKGTSETGFQIFVSTETDLGSWFRGSVGGNWKQWVPVVKSGTTLWSGNAYQAGTILNLSGNLNDFSYIVVQVFFSGYENHVVYHKETANWYIKGINLPDNGSSASATQVEILLSRTSDTSITIAHNHVWQWSGNATDNATIESDNSNFYVRKIVGVV